MFNMLTGSPNKRGITGGGGGANVFLPAQAALPNGAGDVSEGKMARLEKEVKDFTSKLETASAQVRVTFLACLSHYSIG